MKTILVTGSAGLIGSYVSEHFAQLGWMVVGIDNDMRQTFFGAGGSTSDVAAWMTSELPNYTHLSADIRDERAIREIFASITPDAVVHAAAQPSHDRAALDPLVDFSVNAFGTLNLLENVRNSCPEAPFVFLSTNKVYGDRPNDLPIRETESRFEFSDRHYRTGVDEDLSIDQSKHSLFGVSKTSADLLTQEYGRYFGLPTITLRGGCLTGPRHSGVELHGFLSHMILTVRRSLPYKIIGYKGKQVRDQIHGRDVARIVAHCVTDPPDPGSVFNIGGGWDNSASLLELLGKIEQISGKRVSTQYFETPRSGDHICYYTNMERLRKRYPQLPPLIKLDDIVEEMWRDSDKS